MKPTDGRPRFLSIIVALVFVLSAYPALGNTVEEIFYDWNDGLSLQGWTEQQPFGGQLKVNPGFGNPRGSMFAIDTTGGGVLYARAPDEVTEYFTKYDGIYWDEYVPAQRYLVQATFIVLEAGGILYQSHRPTGSEVVTNTWNTRFEPFDTSAWESGTGDELPSFNDVTALFISMDTSEQNTGGVESWVDNFRMTPIPIPGAVWLLGSGLAGLVVIRRKFGKKS